MKSVFVRDENMVFRKIEDEFILVPVKSSAADLDSIYILNEVGARIWELMDGDRTLGEIKDALLLEYETSEEEAEADVLNFVSMLGEIGSVRSTGEDWG